ncbi:hypothetical protein HNQ90_000791 [Algibacter amylolyticus]|nr:hypothetical protein [Algibacter amylolyticus]
MIETFKFMSFPTDKNNNLSKFNHFLNELFIKHSSLYLHNLSS